MSSDIGAVIGGILAVFIGVILIWALYPAVAEIGGAGYAILFLALGILALLGAILSLLGRH
jgi:hypothetical protein